MKSEGCRNCDTNGLVIIIIFNKKQKHIPRKCVNAHHYHYKHNDVVTISMSSVADSCKHPDCEQGSVIQMIQAKPALPCGTNHIPQCVFSFFRSLTHRCAK